MKAEQAASVTGDLPGESVASFSPGPWEVDFEGDLFDATGERLLTSGVQYPGEQDETPWVAIKNDADARLIAAAPDMYAALKELLNIVGCHPNAELSVVLLPVLGMADAALTKATLPEPPR